MEEIDKTCICLWDKNDPAFEDIIKRNELLDTLSEDIAVPAKNLKEHWRNLKNTFRVEFEYSKDFSENGCEAKCKFYEKLSFLREVQPNILASDTPVFNFCDSNGSIDLGSSEEDLCESLITKPEESKLNLDNNSTDESLDACEKENDVEGISKEAKKQENVKLLDKANEESTKKLTSTLSFPKPGLDVREFLEGIFTVLQNANLSRFEMYDMQELLLKTVNATLKEITLRENKS